MKFDKDGIPVLSRSALEQQAEHFINLFDSRCLTRPMFTPLVEIAARLQADHAIPFRFDMDLGYTAGGDKILGRFHLTSRTILVDRSLRSEDPRFHFTLAHELAHLILHRNLRKAIAEDPKDPVISDTRRHLYLDRVHRGSPRDWIEWQANTLASAVVLPRRTVRAAVVAAQNALGITRSLGTVYLDDQPTNRRAALQVLWALQDVYRVSRTAVRIRLGDLGILIEDRKRDLESLGDVISRMASDGEDG